MNSEHVYEVQTVEQLRESPGPMAAGREPALSDTCAAAFDGSHQSADTGCYSVQEPLLFFAQSTADVLVQLSVRR